MKNIKGLNVLTAEDFNRVCPSFYAEAPKHDVSDRYAFLNTREIAVQLWDQGWMPTYAGEQRANKLENKGFTRHTVRWSNPDFNLGNERIELVGVNSHNRSAAFAFYCGVFRMVCANGMITQSADYGQFKVKHVGDIESQVQEAIDGIAQNANLIAGNIDTMKAIELTPDEQGVFARTAHTYIYGDNTAPIEPERLLTARRIEDKGNDLWSTFNRVQENVLKGGLRGHIRNPRTGRIGRRTTRPVKSISKDVKLNKALWSMAEELKAFKLAA